MNISRLCHPSRWVAVALLAGAAGSAPAADMVSIQLVNDHTDDVLVSLYDMNTHPRSKLLSHQKISGFASVPIAVSADANGAGHVYWKATTADPELRKCDRRDKPGLAESAKVHVYAKSECPAK